VGKAGRDRPFPGHRPTQPHKRAERNAGTLLERVLWAQWRASGTTSARGGAGSAVGPSRHPTPGLGCLPPTWAHGAAADPTNAPWTCVPVGACHAAWADPPTPQEGASESSSSTAIPSSCRHHACDWRRVHARWRGRALPWGQAASAIGATAMSCSGMRLRQLAWCRQYMASSLVCTWRLRPSLARRTKNNKQVAHAPIDAYATADCERRQGRAAMVSSAATAIARCRVRKAMPRQPLAPPGACAVCGQPSFIFAPLPAYHG
jgi:hypothetical protein